MHKITLGLVAVVASLWLLTAQSAVGPARIGFQDEGVAQGRGATLNIVGAGASVAVSGSIATLTIEDAVEDQWTYVTLAEEFSTTSNTGVDVTGMSVTPTANTSYEVHCRLLARTTVASTGPRPGMAWPTGLTDGVGTAGVANGANSYAQGNGGIAASFITAVGGLPSTGVSWPGEAWANFRAGANPSGAWTLQLASETNGTGVSLAPYSFCKYRTY
jgi:hypothetical protein